MDGRGGAAAGCACGANVYINRLATNYIDIARPLRATNMGKYCSRGVASPPGSSETDEDEPTNMAYSANARWEQSDNSYNLYRHYSAIVKLSKPRQSRKEVRYNPVEG